MTKDLKYFFSTHTEDCCSSQLQHQKSNKSKYALETEHVYTYEYVFEEKTDAEREKKLFKETTLIKFQDAKSEKCNDYTSVRHMKLVGSIPASDKNEIF